jgi:hypothetical protein
VSRVRENRTHGSMGGRWKRSGTTHGDGLSPQRGNPGTMAAGPTDRRRHRASALPDRHPGGLVVIPAEEDARRILGRWIPGTH